MKDNKLKDMMRENNISQSSLSRRTGVPQPTINRFINGKTASPTFSVMKKLADHFDVSVETLYEAAE
jgi:transcriptional regulator with XRE-family HTH domain|tara:strand:+ start:392 stop:592 length:201 start_codon:yes stop_codon:yes gene_type:complete